MGIHRNSNLWKWFRENNLMTYDKSNYTHLLLDGGKVYIPQELMEKFYIKYAADVFVNQKNYVCEQRTEIFKLHMDLDFLDIGKLKNEEIINIVSKIQLVIEEFFSSIYSSNERMVMICTTDSKKQSRTNIVNNIEVKEEYIKTGIHLIWPYINIDEENALIFRLAVIQYLVTEMGNRPTYNIWEDVVDETIYTTNGLRMLGSSKMKPCDKCKGKRLQKAECTFCGKTGKLHEGRVYKPEFIILGDCTIDKQELQKLIDDPIYMVKQSSIRTTETVLKYNLKEISPVWFNFPQEKLSKKKKRKKVIKRSKNGKTEITEDKIILSEDDKKTKEVRKFVSKKLPNVGVVELMVCSGGDYYICRTDCYYCKNVCREHNTSTMYLYIDKDFMYEKCLSTKEAIGKQGLCKNYKSEGIQLSNHLKNILFEKKKKITTQLIGSNRKDLIQNFTLDLIEQLATRIKAN